MIAHDKGKLAVKRGRKAVSLGSEGGLFPGQREIVWLPKAIEEQASMFHSRNSAMENVSLVGDLTGS